jgi:hypothetical protein
MKSEFSFAPVQMASDYTVKTNQVLFRNGGHVLDFIYCTYNLTRPYHNLGSLTMAWLGTEAGFSPSFSSFSMHAYCHLNVQ